MKRSKLKKRIELKKSKELQKRSKLKKRSELNEERGHEGPGWTKKERSASDCSTRGTERRKKGPKRTPQPAAGPARTLAPRYESTWRHREGPRAAVSPRTS